MTDAQPRSSPDLAHDVASVAGVLSHADFPKGDLADIRRGGARLATTPGFWRVLMDRVDPAFRRTEDQEHTWEILMQAMAVMAPHIHTPGRSLGHVLAEIGRDSHEHRFLRLLRSSGSSLEDQIRLMARLLASHDRAVDWTSLARLLFASEPERERIRRSLARDYYRTRQSATETQS
jgi:CRISPR type I-E-associated protein CasB/Cse2